MEQAPTRSAYDAWRFVNAQLDGATLAFAAGVERQLPEPFLLALAHQVAQLQDVERDSLSALYAAHPRIGFWHMRRGALPSSPAPLMRVGRSG